MYFVQKQGIYWHGVFLICDNKEEAIKECDRLASIAADSYHAYVAYKYGIINKKDMPSDLDNKKHHSHYDNDCEHLEIYRAVKNK
jgi:hypothetical protein